MTKIEKIAVFGGSFDPPHLGHLEIIKNALATLEIDRLFVVPTFLSPFKKNSLFSPQKRLFWLRCLQEELKEDKLSILDYEIRQNKPTPTIETIEFLSQKYHPKQIFLLLGSDQIQSLPKWHSYEKLKTKVEFVIIEREGYKIPASFRVLPMQKVQISSTQLREDLKKEQKELLGYIPKVILQDLIKEK
ncbi:nicotinate (nicotinamide) nucleotide adenylyltransferase [Helicobacter burdigaliensis]|uniref:nicotinate (nicotinamide) nucleotide adenylyltransferase n=1 Tax=Helicobacter burdigaliensis TaxID=2315334 RepID=UPI001E53FBF9|nr:nicotinate (nicotinamide) nucleotide adenylyltransferase [Helicobacter burdigaliensis]